MLELLNRYLGFKGQLGCTILGMSYGFYSFISPQETMQVLGLVCMSLSTWGFGVCICKNLKNEDDDALELSPVMADSSLNSSSDYSLKSQNLSIRYNIFSNYESEKGNVPAKETSSVEKETGKVLSPIEAFLFNAKVVKETPSEDYAIGLAYMSGRGVPKDYQKAFDAFYRGAKQGSSACACKLGTFYEKGICKGKNDILALYWYEESAYQKDIEGYYHLARLYSYSFKNYKHYVYYFLEKACEKNHQEALKLRESLISQEEYNPDKKLLLKLKHKNMFHYAKYPSLREIVFKNGVFKPKDIANAYKVLGITEQLHQKSPEIARDGIRRAYYRKMHLLHPDKNSNYLSDKDNREILEVNKSYLLLTRLIN